MKLESLKNGKLEKNVLSKESLAILKGGKSVSTKDGYDSWTYSCSGPKGELYDCSVSIDGNLMEYKESTTMFPGSSADWYN